MFENLNPTTHIDKWIDGKRMEFYTWLNEKIDIVQNWIIHNTIEVVKVGIICILVYLGVKVLLFQKHSENDFKFGFTSLMCYIIIKIIWWVNWGV